MSISRSLTIENPLFNCQYIWNSGVSANPLLKLLPSPKRTEVHHPCLTLTADIVYLLEFIAMDARSFRSSRAQYLARLEKSISNITSITVSLGTVEEDLSQVLQEISRYKQAYPREQCMLERCIDDTKDTGEQTQLLLEEHQSLRDSFPDQGENPAPAANQILSIQKLSGTVFHGARSIKKSIESLQATKFKQGSRSIWRGFGRALAKMTGAVIPGLEDVINIVRDLGASLNILSKRKPQISVSDRLLDCNDRMGTIMSYRRSVDDTLEDGYNELDQMCEEYERKGTSDRRTMTMSQFFA
ncbi:hypothetical protein FRC08_018339 [Ceratobasidium sp. 394]|nr:hypothetical protein FRC08_018339 [Ceratobasidium sp. 394]